MSVVVYGADGKPLRRCIGFTLEYVEAEQKDGDRVIHVSGMLTNAPLPYGAEECGGKRSE